MESQTKPRQKHDDRTARETEGVEQSGAVDGPDRRPGVPMQSEPEPSAGAHWSEPTRQFAVKEVLHRVELEGPTPVFGTAQPPRGLSGIMRRRAYRIPEHHARHWMLLLAADRVDVLEGRVGSVMARPLERFGAWERAERVRRNPLPALAGLMMGTWLAGRAYRNSSYNAPR